MLVAAKREEHRMGNELSNFVFIKKKKDGGGTFNITFSL